MTATPPLVPPSAHAARAAPIGALGVILPGRGEKKSNGTCDGIFFLRGSVALIAAVATRGRQTDCEKRLFAIGCALTAKNARAAAVPTVPHCHSHGGGDEVLTTNGTLQIHTDRGCIYSCRPISVSRSSVSAGQSPAPPPRTPTPVLCIDSEFRTSPHHSRRHSPHTPRRHACGCQEQWQPSGGRGP